MDKIFLIGLFSYHSFLPLLLHYESAKSHLAERLQDFVEVDRSINVMALKKSNNGCC